MLDLRKFSVLFLLTYFLLSDIVNSNDSESDLITRILLDNYLAECELVFVNVLEDRGNKETGSSSTFETGVLYNDIGTISRGSSGIFSATKSSAREQKVINFQRLADIHRFSVKHCGVAILDIDKVTVDLPAWLFETLTPPYVPIIRKDEDPFVFIFKNDQDANKILLSRRFGSKVRFKLAVISPNLGKGKPVPVLKSVDLYKNAGQPVVQTVKLGSTEVKELFPDSTRNFHGRKVRVANPKAPSHFEMQPLPNGKGFRPLRGIYKVWLDVMMERFNFTAEFTLSSYFGGTGKRLKNNTWVGAVGDVLYERVEMASFNGHIYNRHTVVEWSAPVTYEWMAFVTHKPKSFFSASAIFKPFPLLLWAGFLVSVALICLTVNVILKLNSGFKYHMSFWKTLLYLLASFLEQDANCYIYILHLSPVRVLVIFWLLFALIISTAYRGKLVSLIAFPALSWVPTNFEELAYSNYRVGLNTLGKGGAVYSVLSTSNSPVYRLLFSRLEIFPDSVKCLREALHQDFGCIMVKSIGDVVAYKNFTDKFGRSPFQESDNMALFHADGYIWEKKAVFRQNFDRLTWFIMETGLHGFWFKSDLTSLKQRRLIWEKETGHETTIPGFNDGPTKLKIAHLKGLFYLFMSGISFACICFIMEAFRLGSTQILGQNSSIAKLRNKILNHLAFSNTAKEVVSDINNVSLLF